MRLNCMPIALRFLQITAKHQDFSVLTVFLTIKTSSQNFAITLKLHEHRGDRIGEKSSLERFCKVPSAENYCWSKIGLNGVISLLWLRCHCNTDHDKFSSVVAIFLNVCLWRSNLHSNLVLTLKNCIEPPSYASMAYVVAIGSSFLFDSFIKICATCEIFLGKWLTAPPGKKFPVRLCISDSIEGQTDFSCFLVLQLWLGLVHIEVVFGNDRSEIGLARIFFLWNGS